MVDRHEYVAKRHSTSVDVLLGDRDARLIVPGRRDDHEKDPGEGGHRYGEQQHPPLSRHLERRHQHDRGMGKARPGGEQDEAAMRGRVPRRQDYENTQRREHGVEHRSGGATRRLHDALHDGNDREDEYQQAYTYARSSLLRRFACLLGHVQFSKKDREWPNLQALLTKQEKAIRKNYRRPRIEYLDSIRRDDLEEGLIRSSPLSRRERASGGEDQREGGGSKAGAPRKVDAGAVKADTRSPYLFLLFQQERPRCQGSVTVAALSRERRRMPRQVLQ